MPSPTQCPASNCNGVVERIARYKTTVEWEFRDGRWEIGAFDDGSHFHVFCSQGHELKRWGRDLPDELQRVVFPGESHSRAEPPRPRVAWGAPHGGAWGPYLERFKKGGRDDG